MNKFNAMYINNYTLKMFSTLIEDLNNVVETTIGNDNFTISQRENESDRLLIRSRHILAIVEEFPGNCSWIIVSAFTGVFWAMDEDTQKDFVTVMETITNYFDYAGIFVSGITNNDSIKILKNNFGFNSLLTNFNKHSGNTVELLYKSVL